MDLLNLGRVPWIQTQLVYHSLPRAGREALVLCRPDSPYVCVGYHQDLRSEVDLRRCAELGIPVFRREIGGGTVYLDSRQLFYQLVLRRENPLVLRDPRRFFERFLAPVARALGDLGLSAELRPPCDVRVGGRKISGNGGGDIDGCAVLAGDVLIDFDRGRMAKVLNLPSNELRDLVQSEIDRRVTTLSEELGSAPSFDDLEAALIRRFAEVLPGLSPSALGQDVLEKCSQLERLYASDEWLFEPGKRLAHREIKIAEGTVVCWFPLDPADPSRGLVVIERDGKLDSARALGANPPDPIAAAIVRRLTRGAPRRDWMPVLRGFTAESRGGG